MIQELKSLGTFCPRKRCEYLNLPLCPKLGEPRHCQVMEAIQVEARREPPKRKR